jgi:calcium binding protein 39
LTNISICSIQQTTSQNGKASRLFTLNQLLGELLLDRSNYAIMTKYISNAENLKLMMNLLRERSRNIQFEAFHVFKVFVANPKKSKAILDILFKNKDKLIIFLGNFHNDRSDDEQFHDEKAFLIKQIEAL